MSLGAEVGLIPDHIVLDGDPALPRSKVAQQLHFSSPVYVDQTSGSIRMPLGTEVGLGPGDIVLDGDPAPAHGKGHCRPSPHCSAHFALTRSPIISAIIAERL